jgi:hypothetical protein
MNNIEKEQCDVIIAEIQENMAHINQQHKEILRILQLISQQLVVTFAENQDEQ